MSFFWGPLTPLFWTSVDVCPGFLNQISLARFLACALLLRFTSGAAPANLLTAGMAARCVPTCVSRAEVGCQGWNGGSPVQSTDALPAGPPRRPLFL